MENQPQLSSVAVGAACFLMATMLAGCAASDENYAREHHFVLVPVSGRELSIQSIRVIPNGARPIVAGSLAGDAGGDERYPQHLEISVIAPDGKLLTKVNTNCEPGAIPFGPRNPFHRATYSQRLPFDPPPGSKIRVAVVWN